MGDKDADGTSLVKVKSPSASGNSLFENIWNWVVNATGGQSIDSDGVLTITNTKKTGVAEVPATISIEKVDQYDQPVDGAVFVLKNGNTELGRDTTDAQGKASFTFGTGSGMISNTGALTLEEVSAPNGYSKPETAVWTVNVGTTVGEPTYDEGRDEYVTTTTYTATVDGEDTLEVVNSKNEGTEKVPDTITITKRISMETWCPARCSL